MRWERNRGCRVYFLQAVHGGPIKIGHTINRSLRMAVIGKDLPFDLVEIGTIPGAVFRERFVQCWFRSQHIRGEWFEPTDELWRWALQARRRGEIPEIPSEPPDRYRACTHSVCYQLKELKLTVDDVAATAGCQVGTVQGLFKKITISEHKLLAACSVLFVKRGEYVDWSSFGRYDDEASKHDETAIETLAAIGAINIEASA